MLHISSDLVVAIFINASLYECYIDPLWSESHYSSLSSILYRGYKV